MLENKINWINPQSGEFQTTLTQPILKKRKEIRDNLILQSILNHASNNIEVHKLFLSSNYKQFNKPEVKKEFKQVNIQYFTSSEDLINWLNSNKDPEKS